MQVFVVFILAHLPWGAHTLPAAQDKDLGVARGQSSKQKKEQCAVAKGKVSVTYIFVIV